MTRYHLARTDYLCRYHLQIDVMARKLDAFKVEVMSECARIASSGATLEELWPQALREAVTADVILTP